MSVTPLKIKGTGRVWKGWYVRPLTVDSSTLTDGTDVFNFEVAGKKAMLDREAVIRTMAKMAEWLVKTAP